MKFEINLCKVTNYLEDGTSEVAFELTIKNDHTVHLQNVTSGDQVVEIVTDWIKANTDLMEERTGLPRHKNLSHKDELINKIVDESYGTYYDWLSDQLEYQSGSNTYTLMDDNKIEVINQLSYGPASVIDLSDWLDENFTEEELQEIVDESRDDDDDYDPMHEEKEKDRLKYLLRKEKCCPLDKEETFELERLIGLYGCPEEF